MVHNHQSQQRVYRLLTNAQQAGAHSWCRWRLADDPVATHAGHSRLQGEGLIRYDAATHANQLALLTLLSSHYSAHTVVAAFPDGLGAPHNSDFQTNRAPLQWLLISK